MATIAAKAIHDQYDKTVPRMYPIIVMVNALSIAKENNTGRF